MMKIYKSFFQPFRSCSSISTFSSSYGISLDGHGANSSEAADSIQFNSHATFSASHTNFVNYFVLFFGFQFIMYIGYLLLLFSSSKAYALLPSSIQSGFSRASDYLLSIFCKKKVPVDKRKTIVLDLDESLVHQKMSMTPNSYPVRLIDEREGEVVWVHERPFLKEFLLFCHENFEEVVVYTAGEACYAIPILETLIKKYSLPQFSRIYTRRDCNLVAFSGPVKDLRKVRDDLSKIILIDDNPAVTVHWPLNSINIRAFLPNGRTFPKDIELLKIIPILQRFIEFEGDIKDYAINYSYQ